MFADDPLFHILLIGLGLQGVGFLARDELYLRIFVAAGLGVALVYYLWQPFTIIGPTVANSVFLLINLVLICIIVLERTTLSMSERDKRFYQQFQTLTPGQFRRINRLADWHIAEADKVILTEGEASDILYYIDAPAFAIVKQGKRYAANGPAFAGEIMFLRGGRSSATVELAKGTLYVSLRHDALQRLMQRSSPLRNALVARFSLDMAEKVATSVPMESPPRLRG